MRMKTFIEEFKKFAVKGNVVDLAVAVIIGAAFGKIVSSLVNNIVMPLVGILIGGINFNELSFTLGSAEVAYGVFLQSVIDFLIIALAVFVAIKAMNRLQDRAEEEPKSKEAPKPSEEIRLLREIRDSLKRE